MSYRVREIIKGICLFFIVVSLFAAAMQWLAVDRPDNTIQFLRFGSIVLLVAAFFVFLKVDKLRGEARDHLGELFGEYYDCEGFCFHLTMRKENRVCFFVVFFQNRYSTPCYGRIVLRPTRKFFRRQDHTAVSLEINCPGGSFGRMSVPIPIDESVQGTTQSFDIIAGVNYPKGRGRTLHYGDANVFLRSRVSFERPLAQAFSYVALLAAQHVDIQHEKIKLAIPNDVLSEFMEEYTGKTVILGTIEQPFVNGDL
ncbi:MAG: hypothetical protein J0M26_24740 [Planctomycetes bacterium]|nr:hypothetical protein [Planctomycetota bacterium]